MRKLLVAILLVIIIGFGIVGIQQQINGPEEVIKPANQNTIEIQF